jgi:N utilization substance protein B
MTKFVSKKIRRKSGARLASVQATYMIAYEQLPVDSVIEDFVNGKVGRFVIDENSLAETEEMVEISPIDAQYFEEVVRGVHTKKQDLEKSLGMFLNDKWSFDRMNGVLQSLLLCSVYELTNTLDIDTKVLIQEYVDLAYAFFSKNEPKMVNALLDQIAHSIRE